MSERSLQLLSVIVCASISLCGNWNLYDALPLVAYFAWCIFTGILSGAGGVQIGSFLWMVFFQEVKDG